MDFKIAKCARCEKIFNKIVSEVCTNCQPDEDRDFGLVQDVLAENQHLNVEQVAEIAGVTLECVLRMLRAGRIDQISDDKSVTCGRCGAPAISTSKRLCQRCLITLDRECAQAIHDLRQRLAVREQGSDMNDVMAAVENRRANRKNLRSELERRPLTPTPDKAHRMVMPERLRRKDRSDD